MLTKTNVYGNIYDDFFEGGIYMYEEKSFSLTNLLIKTIGIIVFILVIVWLVSLTNKGMSDSLDVITDNIFAENLNKMKEVGKEYFTIERLPKEVGESNKITLKEMYNKHLILEIKDRDGKACSADRSYVSVEKLENEYQMKVYLECGKESNYIIVVMGCYDYCDNAICEFDPNKKEEEEKQIEYQYVLTKNGKWSDYGKWSDWSTTVAKKSDSKQVETKVVAEKYTTTKDVTKNVDVAYLTKCPTGYTSNGFECVKTIVSNSTSAPIACPSKSGYSVSQNGFNCVYTKSYTPSCPSTYNGYTLVSQSGFTCNYSKNTSSTSYSYLYTKTFTSRPSDTNVYHYEYVSSEDVLSCESSCKKTTIHTYKVYKINYTTNTLKTNNTLTCESGYTASNGKCVSTISATTTCPSGYSKSGNSCTKSVVSYDYKDLINYCPTGSTEKSNGTGCYKTVTEKVTETNTKNVTYYRYRTRTYTGGTTTYKWSFSKNDQNLLKAGYTLTGKTR